MDGQKIKRILIVEDERSMSDIVAKVLRQQGIEVLAAYDGEAGYDKIKNEKPDLVLLDIMLPKLDGRDLLSKVKRDDELKEIPIIIL